MVEHAFDCPSCDGPIIDDRWIQVDVRGGPATGGVFVSRDRYHLECWAAMTEEAVAEARRVPE